MTKVKTGSTQQRLYDDANHIQFFVGKDDRLKPRLCALMAMRTLIRKATGINRPYTSKAVLFATVAGELTAEFKYKGALVRWKMDIGGNVLTISTKRKRVPPEVQSFEYPFTDAPDHYGLGLFEEIDNEDLNRKATE